MINHVRTLLVNRDPATRPPLGNQGEEFIDPTYSVVDESSAVASLKATIFGSDPDDFTLNFRTAEILRLLHGDPRVHQRIITFDPRITYDNEDTTFFLSEWAPIVTDLEGTATLQVTGQYLGDSNRGLHRREYTVKVDATASVMTLIPYQAGLPAETVAINGLPTTVIDLPGGGGSVGVMVLDPGSPVLPASWQVVVKARPARSLFELIELIDAKRGIMQAILADVDSGTAGDLWSMYSQGVTLAERLGGVVLAIAHNLHTHL